MGRVLLLMGFVEASLVGGVPEVGWNAEKFGRVGAMNPKKVNRGQIVKCLMMIG